MTMIGDVVGIVVVCRDYRVERRPRVWRHSCRDCAGEQLAAHRAEFPAHRVELSTPMTRPPTPRAAWWER